MLPCIDALPLLSGASPRANIKRTSKKLNNEILALPTVGVLESLCASVESAARKFLTPEEAAEYLGGLNSRTVTRWAREGYLPSYPIGEGKRRLWRFLQGDLERWMLSRRTGQISIDLQAATDTLFAATDAPSKGMNLDW